MISILKHITLCASVAAAILIASEKAHAVDLIDTSRPKQMVELDVHAGMGMSSIINNYAHEVPNLEASRLSGGTRMMAGIGAELPLRDYLALGTGLDFAINNYSQTMTILDGDTGLLGTLMTQNHFYTLEVPVIMCLRLNLGSRVRWCSEGGLYFGYGLGGTSKTTALTSGANSLGQVQVTTMHYTRRYYESNDPVFCTMRKGDLGVHLGTGILINRRFGVKAVLRIGLRDLAKNFGVYNAHARTLTPTVILSYNLNK